MYAYFTKDTVKIYGVAITMTEVDSAVLRDNHFQATLANRPSGVINFIDIPSGARGSAMIPSCRCMNFTSTSHTL